ncbi:MAG TPA: hypothetical protein VF374_10040 [Thermoplasmata archaeon]
MTPQRPIPLRGTRLQKDIERIVEETSGKLFQISIPAVRYYILTDIMGRQDDDAIVRKTLGECRKYRPRARLLETLNPDGTWPLSRQRRLAEEKGPGPPIGWTYTTMLRNLYDLGEYQAAASEGNIQACLEKLLSWQAEDGHIPGPTTDLFPLPHYNGYAIRMLLKFGMSGDPRVRKLFSWLLGLQRPDGGWVIPYMEDMRYLPQYKHMRSPDFMDLIARGAVPKYSPKDYYGTPSCTWTTLMVIRGLTHDASNARSRQILRGADFVLNHFFKKNYHASMLKSEANWTKLKYPTYLGSGLCALDILTHIGFGAADPRMEKPIKWLLSARSSDGFWSQSDRPHPEKDQWITEIALSILNRYAQSLRGEPFGIEAIMRKARR